MTIGELLDKLKEVKRAEIEVDSWKRALDNGGNEDTMCRKREGLRSAEDYLNLLRDEQMEL